MSTLSFLSTFRNFFSLGFSIGYIFIFLRLEGMLFIDFFSTYSYFFIGSFLSEFVALGFRNLFRFKGILGIDEGDDDVSFLSLLSVDDGIYGIYSFHAFLLAGDEEEIFTLCPLNLLSELNDLLVLISFSTSLIRC